MSQQNENGVGGRDASGRFVKGNQFGPRNPFGRHVAGLRQATLEAVDCDSMQEVMWALLAKAKDGNVSAAKLVLQYVIGKPTAAAEPDRVDVDEWELRRDEMVHTETIKATAQLPTAKVASRMVDELRVAMDEQVARDFPAQRKEDAETAEADDRESDSEAGKPAILPLRTVLSGRSVNDELDVEARSPLSRGRETVPQQRESVAQQSF